MAPDPARGTDHRIDGLPFPAYRSCGRATGCKLASLRQPCRVRDRTGNPDHVAAHGFHVRHGGEQGHGIGMRGSPQALVRGPGLHDAAGIHHVDRMRHVGHQAQIVGNQQNRHPELTLKRGQQFQDLCHLFLVKNQLSQLDQQCRLMNQRRLLQEFLIFRLNHWKVMMKERKI